VRWQILVEHAGALFAGLLISIEVSLLAFVFSFAIGVVVATMRVTPQPLVRALGTAYVEFVRNVPLLVKVFFFYFGLPSVGIRLDGFWSGVCGLSIYTGAFFAEAIRSGILTVSRVQLEAAQASGLSYAQAMRFVVLPQAIRVTIPPIGNTTLNMIKNSSLVSTVSVADILGTANLLGGRTFAYTELLIGAAALYLIITLPTALGINLLERRLART
jgi:putative glutamine transport system permease protein